MTSLGIIGTMAVEENVNFVDYYALLNVAPDAGLQQIRSGYLHLAKLHHPDTGGTNEMMQRLNTAYKTLASSSRAGYDLLHSFHTGTSTVKYRDDPANVVTGSKVSDEYVDFFVDSVFAEYHPELSPKKSLGKRVRELFRS